MLIEKKGKKITGNTYSGNLSNVPLYLLFFANYNIAE